MVFIITEFVSLLSSFSKRTSKLFGSLGLLILGIIAGVSNAVYAPDYHVYEVYYNIAGQTEFLYFEKGYSLLGIIAYRMGADYATFRLIFCILLSILFAYSVSKLTKNVALFTVIYGASVFVLDAIQIRSMAVVVLVIFALTFLVNQTKKDRIIAFIIIFMSSLIQSSGIFFLLIVFIDMVPKKWIHNMLVISSSLMVGLTFLLIGFRQNMLNLMSSLASILIQREDIVSRISGRYAGGSSVKSSLEFFIFTIIMVFISYLIYQQLENDIKDKAKVLFETLLVISFATPLYLVAPDYSRLLRLGLVIFILLFTLYFEHNSLKKDLVLPITSIGIIIIYTYINIHVWGQGFIDSIPYVLLFKTY